MRLVDVDPAADVVLTPDEDAAYKRIAARANAMWALGDPLDRWAY